MAVIISSKQRETIKQFAEARAGLYVGVWQTQVICPQSVPSSGHIHLCAYVTENVPTDRLTVGQLTIPQLTEQVYIDVILTFVFVVNY